MKFKLILDYLESLRETESDRSRKRQREEEGGKGGRGGDDDHDGDKQFGRLCVETPTPGTRRMLSLGPPRYHTI